ncbi:hypothetical protein Ndes2526B_g07853 [Nannochloris sp. 'desiccata']
MGRAKKAEPKASPPKVDASDDDEKPLHETLNKVDDSKTELLDASSIDRSRKIISLDNNKRFKPTSDIIPHDKKDLLSKEVFVLFEEPDDADPSHYGSMYRGTVKRFDPKRKKGEIHYVEFDDGDKGWHNLPEETVIWPDGTVTGPGSKWKEEEPVVENKQAGGGVGGGKRGRQRRTASVQEDAEAEEVIIEVEGQPKAKAAEKPAADAELPQPAEIPLPVEAPAPASALTAEESKKRKAPASAEKPVAVEPSALVVETAALAADVTTAGPQQEQEEEQQPAMASPKKETAFPEKQPPPATATTEKPPKKAKVEHQKLPQGAVKPPPPPPGVPPSRRDSITPGTTALGPSKPQIGQKEQQKHQQGQQQKKQQAPPPPLPTDPKLAVLQQKHRQLKEATDQYLAALDTLKSSSETIKSMVKELESEDMLGKNKAGIPKLVFHTVKNALQPPPSSAGDGGTSNVGWFEVHGTKWLNDVPEAMASMRELLNTWCASSSKPQMPEGPQLKAWAAERSRHAGSEGISSGDKKPAPQQQQKPQLQQQQAKVEEESDKDLIPSTGHEMRDKVVRVLAHALVTATTPVDAAREMEQSLFYQFCRNKNANLTSSAAATGGAGKEESPPELTDAYYDRMRTIWEALSPKSPTCHPILRYMLLTGVIASTELVNITAEQLKMKQDEAMKELGECKPGWLAEQLRNVQLPYYPKPAAAAAPEALPAEEAGPLGVDPPALVEAVQGADGGGPKAVDMEVD